MKIEIDIPEHHYNNIMTLDSVSLGRVPYKGIIMYSINAIKHGKVLEQEPTTWISVSKEMPEEKINVLVTLKSGEIGILKKIEGEDENGYPCYRWMDYEGDDDYEVIAWMPLPKAYEKKEGNKIGWSSLENVREKVERGNEE